MSDAGAFDVEAHRERVTDQRERKEEYFADHPRSPVPDGFAGLDYYPVDPDYRFELDLHEHETVESITVETTAEGEQKYDRVGEFRFEVAGESVSLQAYRPGDGADRLWVPFRDGTSGEATYGAGRYLDLEPEDHRTPDGRWVVDFNLAYNPTCAYNVAYECPLVPMENWLSVPIEAGERDYPGEPFEPKPHGHGHGH